MFDKFTFKVRNQFWQNLQSHFRFQNLADGFAFKAKNIRILICLPRGLFETLSEEIELNIYSYTSRFIPKLVV